MARAGVLTVTVRLISVELVARAGVLTDTVGLEFVELVARAGVQPATFALGVRRSMQLSYRAFIPSVPRGLHTTG